MHSRTPFVFRPTPQKRLVGAFCSLALLLTDRSVPCPHRSHTFSVLAQAAQQEEVLEELNSESLCALELNEKLSRKLMDKVCVCVVCM